MESAYLNTTLGCVPIFKYRDALLQFGTHVIGLAKSAHPLRDKTRCRPKDCVFRDHENRRFSNDAGPVSRPREGADAHGYTRHGCNRRPLLRWQFRCVRVLLVPREPLQRRARAELNSPPVVPLASCQRPRRSHGPPRPWYFTRVQYRPPSRVRYKPSPQETMYSSEFRTSTSCTSSWTPFRRSCQSRRGRRWDVRHRS